MPSQTILKALDSYADVLQRLETIPVLWNKKLRTFIYISNPRKLLVWCIFLFIEACTFVCSCYIVHKELLVKFTLPLWQWLFQLLLCGLCSSGCFLGYGTWKFGQVAVIEWNNFVETENLVHSGGQHLSRRRKVLLIEKLLKYYPFFAILYPPIGSLLTVLLKLDPFHYVFQDILPSTMANYLLVIILIVILRYILVAIAIYFFLRILGIIVMVAVSVLLTTIYCIEILAESAPSNIDLIFEVYIRFKIQYNALKVIVESLAAIGLAIILTAGVGANYATICLYEIIPMPMYLSNPVFSVGCIILIQFVFVPAIHCHEKQIQTVRDLKRILITETCPSRKYLMRRVRTFHPLGVGIGINDHLFFVLQRSTKIAILERWLGFTLDAILAVPVRDLKTN